MIECFDILELFLPIEVHFFDPVLHSNLRIFTIVTALTFALALLKHSDVRPLQAMVETCVVSGAHSIIARQGVSRWGFDLHSLVDGRVEMLGFYLLFVVLLLFDGVNEMLVRIIILGVGLTFLRELQMNRIVIKTQRCFMVKYPFFVEYGPSLVFIKMPLGLFGVISIVIVKVHSGGFINIV